MSNYPFIKHEWISVCPCTMDVHSSIFKSVDFSAWIFPWILHGHFNPEIRVTAGKSLWFSGIHDSIKEAVVCDCVQVLILVRQNFNAKATFFTRGFLEQNCVILREAWLSELKTVFRTLEVSWKVSSSMCHGRHFVACCQPGWQPG